MRPANCTKIIGRISTIATWFASQQPQGCIPFNTTRNHPAKKGGDFKHCPGSSTHARGMRESLFQRQMWAERSDKAAGSDVGSAKWGAGIPCVGFWCGQPEADLPWSVDWGHSEVWMVLMSSLNSLSTASKVGWHCRDNWAWSGSRCCVRQGCVPDSLGLMEMNSAKPLCPLGSTNLSCPGHSHASALIDMQSSSWARARKFPKWKNPDIICVTLTFNTGEAGLGWEPAFVQRKGSLTWLCKTSPRDATVRGDGWKVPWSGGDYWGPLAVLECAFVLSDRALLLHSISISL